jgi:MoaA/NifB/PqqE/SkfB family radical SAM enzyme
MKNHGHLTDYLNRGIEDIIRSALVGAIKNPKEIRFLMQFEASSRKAAKKRQEAEERQGLHIPPFLICSIASRCNLHCSGCYARAGGICAEMAQISPELDVSQWRRIFGEASGLGVSFILVSGGEPLLRRDILELCAEFPNIIFPVFTNGTLLDDEACSLFDNHRNLIPVFSIEGTGAQTDTRRGSGVAQKISEAFDDLKRRGIVFGVSITVTRENLSVVTEKSFVSALRSHGCSLLVYVEYVPAEAGSGHLVLSEEGLAVFESSTNVLKDDADLKDFFPRR